MKMLLDENIDVRFKHAFDKAVHDVFTVRDMQWTGILNGELLKLLEQHAFDVWIAVAKNLPYQQNTRLLPVTIIVLDVKRNVPASLQMFSEQLGTILSQPLHKKVIVLKGVKS